VKLARTQAKQCHGVIAKVHKLAVSNYAVILDSVKKNSEIEFSEEVFARENKLSSRVIKNLKTQINDNLRALHNMQDISAIFAAYDPDSADKIISVEQAIAEFQEHVKVLRNCWDQGQSQSDIVRCIRYCEQDVKHYYDHMMLAFQSQNCWFDAKNSWPAGIELEKTSAADRNRIVKGYIEQLYNEFRANVTRAGALAEGLNRWSTARQCFSDLLRIKDAMLQKKATIFDMYQCMFYKNPDHFTAEERTSNNFLLRARFQFDFSWLFYANKDNPDKLTKLLDKAKQLHQSYQKNRSSQALTVCRATKEQYARIPRDLSWSEIKDIANSVRCAKEELELDIRDDVELMELASNHVLYYERDSSESLQAILAVESKLQYIKDHFVPLTQESSSEEFMDMLLTQLNQLHENISLAGLRDDDRMQVMMNAYDAFRTNCQGKMLPEMRRCGLIFLSQMVELINNHSAQTTELNKQIADIREQKFLISEIIDQDSKAYTVARKKALKALQMAYQHIHALNDLMHKNKFGIEHHRYTKQFTSVANTLMWSSSLSVAEQKWVDSRNDSSSKMMAETREYKSPHRMAYSFILDLIIERLTQKNQELIRLNQIQKHLPKPKSPTTSLVSGLPDSPLETKSDLTRKALKLRQKIEQERDNLKLVKDLVFSKSLKIFFNEWKIKASGEENLSKVTSFMTRIPLAAKMQITGSEHTEQSSEQEEDSEQYSIGDFEEMVESTKLYVSTKY
jgi:hypothetical protein